MLTQLTLLGAISLLNFFTCIFIGTFLLIRHNRSPVNISYCAFDFCIAFYAFFYFLWQSTTDAEQGVLFFKLCITGVILINSAFLHFSYALLSIHRKKINHLIVIHTVNLLFCFFGFNGFYSSWVEKYNYGLWPIPTTLFNIYLVWWFAQVIYSFFIIYMEGIAKSSGFRRYQFKWVFWATLVAFVGGATNWLVWYGIQFPPYMNSGIALYALILSYAIFKHKLLGIDVIIKRTLVFTGLLAFVFAVFSAATLLVREVLFAYFKVGNAWTYAISLFLIVLGYDHIRNLLINLTDNYLFQKKYDYQKLLKEASRGMSRIKSLEHLLSLVVHFITMKMRVSNAGVLTRVLDGNTFCFQYQRGYQRSIEDTRLSWEHPLIEYMAVVKEVVDIEQVKERIANPDLKNPASKIPFSCDYAVIQKTLEEMGAACCIPSFLGQELRNVLVLGAKKSGDYFTEEDHNVLLTLAQESAIAIENARLYDEQVNKSRELQQINTQLETAKSSLLGALQETELANKRLQDTQAQLIHEQKMATLGRLAASVGHEVNNPLTILSMNVSRAILKYRKNPEAKISEILDIFTKMEQNINRIKAVVNTLTGLLKKSEKGKFEPLSLKLILEETLPLVQFQTYLDNLAGTEVEFIVPGNIPLVRGDLERLQEVFLNLFINAYHAMEGRSNPKITVTADAGDDSKFVSIHFGDTGKGMTEETAKRIFNYGFTTKPAGKGSGLGLYMCKYIIELHGGEIRVASEVDKGTTFTLTLPIFEETGTNFADQEYRTA